MTRSLCVPLHAIRTSSESERESERENGRVLYARRNRLWVLRCSERSGTVFRASLFGTFLLPAALRLWGRAPGLCSEIWSPVDFLTAP